ncbi:MAG: phospholipase C, phosphocholine-specific [Chitinophagaceae bacterium]|nr:phospholipase C, phosphocholine-specific [Chitinophagaceae bacterium]
MDSRRSFLKKTAVMSSGTALLNSLPPGLKNALAINAPDGSTYLDAEHVVFLMQENRSFDHCFGTLKGVRGFNDPRTVTLPNKLPVWFQPLNSNTVQIPFRLDMVNSKATWMNSLPHSWSNQVDARNNGKYDGWLTAKKHGNKDYNDIPVTLGYFNRQDIPFYYALADSFTVCDHNFCSSLTGTTPNRLYFWSGTIRKSIDSKSMAHVWNGDSDYGKEVEWETYPEKLEKAGVSWKVYQNEISVGVGFNGEEDAWLGNFTDNPLEFFKQYNTYYSAEHQKEIQRALPKIEQELKDIEAKLNTDIAESERKKLTAAYKSKVEWIDTYKKRLFQFNEKGFESDFAKAIHDKAFTTNKSDINYHSLEDLVFEDGGEKRSMKIPKGDILHQFRQDVKTGNLPTVSWLVAPERFSDHPDSPWYGAWYISEVFNILTENPEIWKKTIFVITYDENDGQFDHLAPFTPPNPYRPNSGKTSEGIDVKNEYVTHEQQSDYRNSRESPIGLGFRVPLIICSPWSKGGWVNSEVFDHTSSIQFLEHFLDKKWGKKVVETNITSWRRTICGNLTSAFRPIVADPAKNPKPVEKDPFMQSIFNAQFKKVPDGYQTIETTELINKTAVELKSYLPEQEKGVKPANALKYEMIADAWYDNSNNELILSLGSGTDLFGKESLGVPFTAYAKNSFRNEARYNRSYAVRSGDTIRDRWMLAGFPNEQYQVELLGPDGFYREFEGSAADPKLKIKSGYRTDGKSKWLVLECTNNTEEILSLQIVDPVYKKNATKFRIVPATTRKPFTELLINTDAYNGWYDITITIKGYDGYLRRYAGKVENGKESTTDPLMGKEV